MHIRDTKTQKYVAYVCCLQTLERAQNGQQCHLPVDDVVFESPVSSDLIHFFKGAVKFNAGRQVVGILREKTVVSHHF